MRSIRLSLIVCFIAWLVLSLTAVSVLVYEQAQQSLAARKETIRNLLHKRYEEHCADERAILDTKLLADARNLASIVEVHVERELPNPSVPIFFILGLLTATPSPDAHLTSPLWIAEGIRGWNPKKHTVHYQLYWEYWKAYSKSKLHEMTLPPDPGGQAAQIYQINSFDGVEWHYPSNENIVLPFDPEIFANDQIVDWRFDDVIIEPGKTLRRAILKVARLRIDPFIPKARLSSRIESTSSIKLYSPPAPIPKWAVLFIQSARDTAELQSTIAQFEKQLNSSLQDLEFESEQSLADLRNRLLLISLITCAVALVGVCWLVSIGLAPLRRLSDAVSRVSEKDFTLRIDDEKLPTELQPICARIEQTLRLLKRAFAREKQAAADISHELRTPLAAMLTTLDVALRKQRSADEYRELLEECRSMGQQMTQQVERMLALARLDAGADHLRPQEVDVWRIADQCASMVRPLAEARGVTLSVEHTGDTSMHTDPDKLREVLTNLLHNAIEYNKPGGSIHLLVARCNGKLKMQVTDTGIGISPEAKEQIFQRFFREDPSRQANSLHAGIGLALVKGYVELMGGAIHVDSKVGVGTTFRIELPVENRSPSVRRR